MVDSDGARGMLCIFRMKDGTLAADEGAHETGDKAERIELGPGARDVTAAGALDDYTNPNLQPVLRKFTCGPERRDVENPAPLLDESRRPDISYGGAEYNITVNFPMSSDVYDDQSLTLKRLLEWDQTPSTIKKEFPLGRYGIRNNALPYQDCEPNQDAGYLLSMVKADWDLAFDSFVPVTIVMRHAGKSSRLNTGWRLAEKTAATPSQPRVLTYRRNDDPRTNGVRP